VLFIFSSPLGLIAPFFLAPSGGFHVRRLSYPHCEHQTIPTNSMEEVVIYFIKVIYDNFDCGLGLFSETTLYELLFRRTLSR
jgi:hypothetical protein